MYRIPSTGATSHGVGLLSDADFLAKYIGVIWAFQGIHTIATAAAQVPLRLFYSTGTMKVEITEHPFLRVIANPNEYDTRFKLFWKTFSFLELCGNAYWIIDGEGKNVQAIYCVRPDKVRPLTNDGRFYSVNFGDEIKEFSREDIVHFSTFSPFSDLFGISPLMPAKDSMIIELYLIKYDQTFYENAERPKQYIKMPDGVFLEPEDIERLHEELNVLHGSVERFHRTAVLQGGMELVELKNIPHADLDFMEHKRITREEILTALGCYHLMALLKKSSNKSEIEMAYRLFYELTLLPKLVNVAQTIDKFLLKRWEDQNQNLVLEFDIRTLKGMRENLLAESQADVRYVQMGIRTINEIRAERGFGGPLPWGNQPPKTAPVETKYFPNEPNELRGILEPKEREEM